MFVLTVPINDGWMNVWRGLRDILLFLVGVIGVAHETFLTPVPRVELLILFAGALGLPVFLRANQVDGGGK